MKKFGEYKFLVMTNEFGQVRLGKDLAAKIRGCDVELLKLNQEELDNLMTAMLVDMQVVLCDCSRIRAAGIGDRLVRS
jgi:hypothetical protein